MKDNSTPEQKCNLSNDELIERCNEWVSRLAKSGGRDWRLTVPVNFNTDPDMLFCELVNRFKALLPPLREVVSAEDVLETCRLHAESMMYSKSWDRKDAEMVGVFYKFFIDKLFECLTLSLPHTTAGTPSTAQEHDREVASKAWDAGFNWKANGETSGTELGLNVPDKETYLSTHFKH